MASSVANRKSTLRERRATQIQRYSLKSLLELVAGQDGKKGDVLAQIQKDSYDLKRQIALASKKNFTLERDIRNLDKKISLLIRNRISLEEVMAQSGDLSLINKTTTLKDRKEKQIYGKLFYVLQTETNYIAKLATLVKVGEIDNLLQTVMFTLYGNQYDEYEEHLLLSMFQQVLDSEFGTAKSFSNLLRANTALTRMMTTYTRRSPGQHYLKSTISTCLQSICADSSLNLEINPLKVYEQMINDHETSTGHVSSLNRNATPEEAALNKDVIDQIKQRVDRIGRISDGFVDGLINSLEAIPYGIRWICKQIRELVRQYFPDASREQQCSLIGGFFLLRFVNPAIATPQAFMLVDSKLSPATRRNLTLLAKVMQNLANNIPFGGVKESYMDPLNVVLDRNKEKLNCFFESITRVDDLSEHLRMDRYLVLGRTENQSINISLNEIYFIHSLLKQHSAELFSDTPEDGALKKILFDLGDAPPQLMRKDNANVDLVLDKSARSDDPNMHSLDHVYAETKYLIFVVLKSVPEIAQANEFTISDLLEKAQEGAGFKGNVALYESVERIKENINILVEEGFLSEENDYAKLRKDAVAELLLHEQRGDKAFQDLEKLKEVLTTINEHHTFLQEQFTAYTEYLENVRSNCNRTKGPSNSSSSSSGSSSKKKDSAADKKKKKPAKPRGPFKYSHSQLEKDGVIVSSDVPDDRRSNMFFVFSSTSPGLFEVVVMYGRRHLDKMTFQLDDLLERQHNRELQYETEFLKLSINLLIFLLNKDFVA